MACHPLDARLAERRLVHRVEFVIPTADESREQAVEHRPGRRVVAPRGDGFDSLGRHVPLRERLRNQRLNRRRVAVAGDDRLRSVFPADARAGRGAIVPCRRRNVVPTGVEVTRRQFLLEDVHRREAEPVERAVCGVAREAVTVGVPDVGPEKRRKSVPVVRNSLVPRCNPVEGVPARLGHVRSERLCVERRTDCSDRTSNTEWLAPRLERRLAVTEPQSCVVPEAEPPAADVLAEPEMTRVGHRIVGARQRRKLVHPRLERLW